VEVEVEAAGAGGASDWLADARAQMAATDARADSTLRARGVVNGLAGLSRAAAEEAARRGGGGGAPAAARPEECTICMDPLGVRNGPGADGTITTACGHRFHRKCINHWLNEDGKTTCPLCRAALNPPFVGIAGRRQYGAKRYRKRATRKQGTRKQGKYYKKKTRSAKSRNI
jgi:hypothetical protein